MNENFNEKIGLNVSEAANMLGISKNLMSELIKYPDFPCIKFKRRIVINKKKLQDWFDQNSGRFFVYLSFGFFIRKLYKKVIIYSKMQ